MHLSHRSLTLLTIYHLPMNYTGCVREAFASLLQSYVSSRDANSSCTHPCIFFQVEKSILMIFNRMHGMYAVLQFTFLRDLPGRFVYDPMYCGHLVIFDKFMY